MPELSYAVTAIIPDPKTADDYLAWLTRGHTAAVIAGGATSAAVIVLDTQTPADPARIETRYRFPSRAVFAAYEAGPAVPLREDGKSRFAGRVQFERRVGEVVG